MSTSSLKNKRSMFNMLKASSGGKSERSHRCGPSCLGPLTFHHQSVGDMITLSQGGRLAERMETTFNRGLVFSSRPLRVQERICVRVEKDSVRWHGALRVGFTNMPPSMRSLPLPPMAIPDLTAKPGHWVAAVHESFSHRGSEFEFWVSHGGSVYVRHNTWQVKLLEEVDVSRPLWAVIDIYGQTRSILLLGSEKRGWTGTKSSCPAPKRPPSPDDYCQYSSIPDEDTEECTSCLDMEVPADGGDLQDCVVCMGREAKITLPCGHRCLCRCCAPRLIRQFGRCPLCRHEIRPPSGEAKCVVPASSRVRVAEGFGRIGQTDM